MKNILVYISVASQSAINFMSILRIIAFVNKLPAKSKMRKHHYQQTKHRVINKKISSLIFNRSTCNGTAFLGGFLKDRIRNVTMREKKSNRNSPQN